ncbi:hypothetical protein [Streptomyces sp. NBC_00046]|uniref:hypothetical protein n=1 Tax=unclassified Streptomyces TaxID=2593676 RepID=UPI00324DC9C7
MPTVVTGVAGAEAMGGRTPAIRRKAIAGRRAMIRGGAVRRGRTAAGRACWSGTGAGAVPAVCRDADEVAGPRAASGSGADGVPLARVAPAVVSRVVAASPRLCRPGAPFPEDGVDVVAPYLWTVAGAGRPPALPLRVVLPAVAAAGPAAGSVSPSVPVRAARSSSGPPGAVDRAPPGRATP